MNKPGTFDAIVIGAGTNGLAAAAVLGRANLRVLVLERNEVIGGQRRVEEFAPGFRAAPLAHDDGWFPPAAARALGLIDLERAHPDFGVTVATNRGGFLTLGRDPARAADSIRSHSSNDAEKWPAFTALLRRLSGFLETLYQMRAPDIDASGPGELVPLLGLAKKLRAIGREGMTDLLRIMPMSIEDLLDDWFESTPVKAAIGAGGVQNIQQGPRSGGTAFVLLHHLVGASAGSVRGRGWWRVGPDALARALEESARRHSVSIRTGAAVTRILVRDDTVTGVVLTSGEEILAPRVLSTADPVHSLLDLVDPVWLDPEFLHAVQKIKLRGCAATVLYAMDALPDMAGISLGSGSSVGPREAGDATHPLAGVVSLTPSLADLEQAADAAKYGTVSGRPHVELTAQTLRWPTLAPAGKHVLVARVQYAPYRLRDGAGGPPSSGATPASTGSGRAASSGIASGSTASAWDAARGDALADTVTTSIESAMPGFTTRVLQRVALTPRDIAERYGLTQGAVTHGEITLDQILFMRPVAGWAHYAMPIDGLYLGGSGTHPGPGVLGGPGWLAAQKLLEDRGGK